MVLGLVIVAVAVGLISAIWAYIAGAGLLIAFVVYVCSGLAVMVTFTALTLAISAMHGLLRAHRTPPAKPATASRH